MGEFYYKLVKKHTKRTSFVVLVSFLVTFVVVRIYVVLGTMGIIEDPNLYIRGYHVHHLNYGIVILALVGLFSLFFQNAKNKLKIGVLYGIGLGLTFDEFGMWFKLEDDYWMRLSYDAIIIISVILSSIVYFPSFWYRMINGTQKGFDRVNNARKKYKKKKEETPLINNKQ